MASIWFGIEYSWNDFLGYSALSNPLEIFGLILILITLGISLLTSQKILKGYLETKNRTTLTWALAFLFLQLAVIFLIFEKVSYSGGNAGLGDLMAIIAIICVGFAILCFDNFAFNMTFPDKAKILTVIVSAMAILYVAVLIYAIATGPPLADVKNFELVYSLEIDIMVYILLIPIISIAPIVFFIFYYRNREKARPTALRSLWFGIALLCFAIGYIAEVAPFFPPVLAVPMRSFFLVTALILYICFVMPNWFKNSIGWTD